MIQRHTQRTKQMPSQLQKQYRTFNTKKVPNLIFYGSEDEQESSQEDNHNELCQTARETTSKKSTISINFPKQSCRIQSIILKPSLMHLHHQNQIDYYEQNTSFRKIVRKKNNYVTPSNIKEEERKEVRNEKIDEQKCYKQQQNTIANEEQNKTRMNQGIKESKAANMLFFEDSQDQTDKNPQKTSKQTQKTINIAQNTTSIQQKSTAIEQLHQKSQQFNILTLNKSILTRSSYFSQIINNTSVYQSILQLMFMPLLPETIQYFQVHVYNSILQKSFQLWYSGPSTPVKKCLMKAKKSVRINKTYYQILTYIKSYYQYCQTCTMVSNLQRSQFNIELNKNNQTFLLGTIVSTVTIKNSRNLVLYYPQKDKIAKNQTYQSLRDIFRETDNHNIGYIATGKLTVQQKLQLMRQHRFRPSDKSIEFKNKKQELKLVIGKKESKQYGLIAGSELTPIQIFSLAIINIQTN